MSHNTLIFLTSHEAACRVRLRYRVGKEEVVVISHPYSDSLQWIRALDASQLFTINTYLVSIMTHSRSLTKMRYARTV